MMTTVRELIQALVLNCDLDDKVEVEFMQPLGKNQNGDETFTFKHENIRHVFHLGEGHALIECHDE